MSAAVFVWPVVDEDVPVADLLDEARDQLADVALASRIVLSPLVRMSYAVKPGYQVPGSGGARLCVVGTVPRGAERLAPRPYHARRPGLAGLIP